MPPTHKITETRKSTPTGSSAYKGVSFHRKSNKWQAIIFVNGLGKSLGYFTDERAAAVAYNTAALEHYEEFANLNELD